ncbi:MAG: T9SS type A sorting domain-containing protein, partial [Bacteroidales bacterium]|nr:T9SS type A sorting domain-containing protein [Bacteroidales bacterium]
GQSESLREGYAELSWDPYVGVDYRSFYIIRETTVNNYTFIDTVSTVPASLTSYTAEIPTVGKSIYYVGIKLNELIDPKDFMKAESGPFSLALSNIAEAENMDQDAVSELENSVVAYAAGHTIYVKNVDGKTIELYDASGRKINTATGSEITEFAVRLDGIYFVKVEGETFKVIVR